MPTILREGPYRFYFYSHEPNEPPPTHVSLAFVLFPMKLSSTMKT